MTTAITVEIQRLPHSDGLALPAYQTAHAAGLDLLAAVPEDKPLTMPPGQRALVPTGLMIAVPPGHEAQVRPRSGLALKHGVTVLNAPGTVDADYPAWRAHRPACDRRGDAGKLGCRDLAVIHGSRQRRVRFHREVVRSSHEARIAPHNRARTHYFAARFTFTVWTLTRRVLLRILSFDS